MAVSVDGAISAALTAWRRWQNALEPDGNEYPVLEEAMSRLSDVQRSRAAARERRLRAKARRRGLRVMKSRSDSLYEVVDATRGTLLSRVPGPGFDLDELEEFLMIATTIS